MKKGILFLAAGLLLAGALPLAEAAPKRNCGNRCELDYEHLLEERPEQIGEKELQGVAQAVQARLLLVQRRYWRTDAC